MDVHLADPWKIARSRYLETLEPDERVLFHEATIENLYYSTSNSEREDGQTSKSRIVMRRIQPLVDKIEDYGKAMDAYANIAPAFLAPIWGSIRVLLVIAKSYGKFYDKMAEALGRIGDILPRFRDYQLIFSHAKHPRLTKNISETYLDIIELCMDFKRVIKKQSKNGFLRIIQPLNSSLDQHFEEAVTRFRRHKKNVEREAETCHMIECAEERALVLRERALQKANRHAEAVRKSLDLLSSLKIQEKHKRVLRAKHKDTGSWIFPRPEYISWININSTSVLCCYGIPGCGKTVLASTVIHELVSVSQVKQLAYHYCDYADKQSLEPTTILGTLARTLLEQISDVPPEILNLIDECTHDGERVPETSDILKVFMAVISLFDSIFLVLDGIDEMKDDDRQEIFRALKKIVRSQRTRVKLFVSSREDITSEICLDHKAEFRIKISTFMVSSDIQLYVQHVVDSLIAAGDLVIRKAELKLQIVDALINGAKGMFLWVKFQLDELCTKDSDDAIKHALRNLPKDLSETYRRLLSRVLDPQRQCLVQKMFKSIVCARRPLLVDELCEAIAFSISDDCWNEDKIPTDIFRLIRACGSLVVVEEDTEVVRLAHYTVQQYILSSETRERTFCFNIQEANDHLGGICLAYLNFSDFETQIIPFSDNRVTANMARIERAVTDLSIVQGNSSETVKFFYRMFFKTAQSSNIDFNRYILKKPSPVEHLLGKYQLLPYIRQNWLWHTASFLPDSGSHTRRSTLFHNLIVHKQLAFPFKPWGSNAKSNHKYPLLEPLGWALVTNHCPLVQTLTAMNSDFRPEHYVVRAAQWAFDDFKGTHISEDLCQRIEYCNQDIWESRAIPGIGWLYSRILEACRRGNLEILRLCMPSKAVAAGTAEDETDENQAISLRGHLVLEAAIFGHHDIVAYLTQSYCPRLTIGHQGEISNALEIAVMGGHINIVRILSGKGWIPSRLLLDEMMIGLAILMKAMDEDNLDMVGAILEALRPSPYGEYHKSYVKLEKTKQVALLKAASTGRLAMVRLLCENGVDALESVDGKCAYMQAIKNGKLEVFEYLVHSCGLHSNSEGLPLTMAASMGHLQIAKSMVAHAGGLASASNNEFTDEDELIFRMDEDSRMSPSPLYAAAHNGQIGMVKYLLANGAHSDMLSPTSGSMRSPSKFYPESEGKIGKVYFKNQQNNLTSALPVAETSMAGWQRPLAGAASLGHSEVVKLLLKTQVEVDAPDSNGDTALLLAAAWGHTGVYETLVNAGATIQCASANATAKFMACAADLHRPLRAAALNLLYKLGVSKNISVDDYWGLLMQASRQGDLELVQILLSCSKGYSTINRADANGFTPLLSACKHSATSTAKLLLEKGADVERKVKDYWEYWGEDSADRSWLPGATSLTIAAFQGATDLVTLLLKSGARIESRNARDQTSLLLAIAAGKQMVVRTLVASGASLRAGDNKTLASLEYAVKFHNLDIFNYLLEIDRSGMLKSPRRPEFLPRHFVNSVLTAREYYRGNSEMGVFISKILEHVIEMGNREAFDHLLNIHEGARPVPPSPLFSALDLDNALSMAKGRLQSTPAMDHFVLRIEKVISKGIALERDEW